MRTHLLTVLLASTFATPALADGSLLGEPVYGESGVNFFTSAPFDDAGFAAQTNTTGVIGAGQEIVLSAPNQTFDFSDDGSLLTIHLNTAFASLPFNGFRLRLTDPAAPNFTGFAIVSNTFPGFNSSDVALSGPRIALNFEGLSGVGDITLRLFNDGLDLPELAVSGTCPGPVDIDVSNLTPGGRVALLKGTGLGSNVIPAGPCAGEVSDLQNLGLQALLVADVNGEISLSPTLRLGACGRVLQALDVETCALSEPVYLP
jgi:hypothetical protein